MVSHNKLKQIDKVWGREIWLANEPEYCGKFLVVKKGGLSSLHYHWKKKETFYAQSGVIKLIVESNIYILTPEHEPMTILPKQKHQFYGIEDSILIEISTHHNDNDVYRLTKSQY